MANIKSNIKRNKQNKARNVVVHSQKSAMKTQIKKTRNTKSDKDLSLAYKKIDSALSKGIIKQNKADRLKQRLALNNNKA
ncbi:MAG: 30S ribosomal protein S20 [Malacoplasma sp.]|nr:30S ribosomal protein S20 [Malacoplasma sp.]MDE5775095.1 30S ribosomal protein S20 [Malacoplasma sp.]MDE5949416.1 30S ribosomal protein S20 [Malacoplasma sp.]MDE5952570.1 30S ribosomal protein S20 [Malacoplasma sp.]MDE6894341.1 30S ribosomal protein S20 [Malacoplasma sp.]